MKKIFTICLIINLFLLSESKGQDISEYDFLILKDSVHSVTFDEQTGWNSKRALMEKLLRNTSLISLNASVTDFYNTYKDDNIGLLSKIRLAIDTVNKVEATVMATIQNNLSFINSFGQRLGPLVDSIVEGEGVISDFADQFQLYSDSAQGLASVNDSLYQVIQSVAETRANAIKSINDGLSTTKIYEQNEITVNSIFLATSAIDQSDSLINYSAQLYRIARQCILNGGPSVAYARNLYRSITDSVWFNDDQICASPNDSCLVPLMPQITSVLSDGVCGHQYNYTVDTMLNVTGYTWAISGGAVIDSGQGSTSVWVSYPDTFVMGHISVYATNSCGDGLVRDIVITGYPDKPEPITGASALCPYAVNVPFSTDSVQGATNYTWVVPSGCMIDSGQGTARIVVDWDDLPGDVIVVASNACGSSDSAFHYVDISTNCRSKRPANHPVTSDASSGSDFKIFPNPTKGNVTVVYHLQSDKGLLQLFDVTGRMMNAYRLDGKKNRFEFDIADLCCGIFEYRVIDNETVQGQGKLVIVR